MTRSIAGFTIGRLEDSAARRAVVCFFCALACFCGPAAAGAQSASALADSVKLDLAATIRHAIDVSPEVAAANAKRSSAEARSTLARASRFLTEFTATSAHAPAPGLDNPNSTPTDQLYLDPDVRNDWDNLSMFNEVEVSLIQPLHTWGELSGNIKAARAGAMVESGLVRQKEIEVAFRAADAYYSLLLAEALKRVAADAGDVVSRAKREIDRLLKEGAPDVDDADLFQVLITEQEFNRRVVEVDERLRTAEMGLRRLLFIPDGVSVAARDRYLQPLEFEPDPLEDYLRIGLTNRPELDAAASGVAARNALVGVAKSNYFPKLFLGGRFRAAATPNRFSQRNPYVGDRLIGSSLEAGLGLRLQLNFAQTRARVEQARAQRNEVGYQLDGLRQLVRFEVEEAYRSLRIKRAALESQQEALRLSKEWLQLESVNFDLDLGDTENLVRAVQSNLQLQAAEYLSMYEYNIAVLKLLRACGILVEHIESGTLLGK